MSRLTRLVGAIKTAWNGEPLREAAGATVDHDEDQWRRLSGDSDRDLSPLSQARMQETALYLWDGNLLANRIIELPLAYLLAEGVQLRMCKQKDANENDDEDMLADLQKVLDRFWWDPINSLDMKLVKKVRELSLFGEQCWPVFVNEIDGHVRLGYLDPAQIATVVIDPDNPEQPIGIVTTKDKRGQARRYRIIVNGTEEVFTERTREIRKSFTDGDCFFFAINDLSTSRRGRSDLRAPADWVDAYDEFLFGELDRYKFQRAFVWDVTVAGMNDEAVKKRAREITAPPPGAVRVHNESETWNAVSPDLKAGDTAEGARLIRNHALGGVTIPEHWFGGGGDVNRASAAEMGEPTFKMLSMRQRIVKYMLEQLGTYVLRRHLFATEGTEPEWDDPRTACEAIFPELTARDTTKYAAALAQVVTAVAIAVEKGLLTQARAVELIGAVAGRLGVEFDAAEELEAALGEVARRREADTFPPPGDPELPDIAA